MSAAALIILSPVLIVTAILVKATSKVPAAFKQERLGLDCKAFTIYKCRSMCEGAEHAGSGLSFGKGDMRVTKVGKIIRATSIDELPQLVSILKGKRGIIGTTKKNADFSRVVTVNSISL